MDCRLHTVNFHGKSPSDTTGGTSAEVCDTDWDSEIDKLTYRGLTFKSDTVKSGEINTIIQAVKFKVSLNQMTERRWPTVQIFDYATSLVLFIIGLTKLGNRECIEDRF